MENETDFEIAEAGLLRVKYGLYAENRSCKVLNPQRVPTNLRHLIPLAEKFGETDDLIRDDIVAKATSEEKEQLRAAVQEADDLLDEWLAGPEAKGPDFTVEYLAFSAMRMASDAL